MAQTGNLRRLGTVIGLFSSGAAVGILTDRNVPVMENPFLRKEKQRLKPVPESKEGKICYSIRDILLPKTSYAYVFVIIRFCNP